MSETTLIYEPITTLGYFPGKGMAPGLVDGNKPQELDVNATGLGAHGVDGHAFMVVQAEGVGGVHTVLPFRDRENTNNPGLPEAARRLLGVQPEVSEKTIKFTWALGGSIELNTTQQDTGGERYGALVQKKIIPVYDQGDDAAAFFSEVYNDRDGKKVRLVWADRVNPGQLPEEYLRPGYSSAATGVDSTQLVMGIMHDLLTMQRLNNRHEDPEEVMARFRVDLLLGGQALATAVQNGWPNRHPAQLIEDYIDLISITDKQGVPQIRAGVVEPCHRRCDSPNTNPVTFAIDGLASKTLEGRHGISDTGQVGVLFTSRLQPKELPTDGVRRRIAVGDHVGVLLRGTPRVTLPPFRSDRQPRT